MNRKISWIPGAVALAVVLLFAGPALLESLKHEFFDGHEWERTVLVGEAARQTYLVEHPDCVNVMLLADFDGVRKIEDEINASGVLGRRKLKIDQRRQSQTLAEQLAILSRVTRDPSYFAVIGPVGSSHALHAASILCMAGVPLLPLSAISPRLSEFPNTLMAHPSAKDEADALIADFATNGVKRLAIVHDESVDWSIRSMAMEDAAMHCDIDVPINIFFNAHEDIDWMRFVYEDRLGTTGVALLAPYEGPSTKAVVDALHVQYDKHGPLRILSLPKTDRAEDIRRSFWVFATAFANAEKSGVPTGTAFVRAAKKATMKTPLGTFSFGSDRFLSPDCPIIPLVR